MIEWLFNRGNFMKINKYKKIFIMLMASIGMFFLVIMIHLKVYGYYNDEFKMFLVTKSVTIAPNVPDAVVPVDGKTTATIAIDNKTYEIPFSLNFKAIAEYVNNNCVKNGSIDNSLVDSKFSEIAYALMDSADAKGSLETKYYNNLSQIIGRVKNVIMNKRSVDNLEEALTRDGIVSEVYNSDGTVNTDQSSNSSPTKEKLLNKSYSDIKKDLNDTNKVYWGGSKGNERKYKGIDDNSSLSDSDKKEIKEKWAEEAVKNSSGNIDANVKEYLSAEINAIKDKRYYRNPAVNTEDSSSGLDDAISDADSFIETGDNNKLQISSLQAFSRNIYNILLTIGIVVAVLTGAIIGIKYMLGSVEEKADIKGLLIPYIAGCVIIFGSFAIWKLIVTLLQGI